MRKTILKVCSVTGNKGRAVEETAHGLRGFGNKLRIMADLNTLSPKVTFKVR
jgi:hypothetical protein